MNDQSRISLSAAQRAALRKALTSHPTWKSYAHDKSLRIDTMSVSQLVGAANSLDIAPSVYSDSIAVAFPKSDKPKLVKGAGDTWSVITSEHILRFSSFDVALSYARSYSLRCECEQARIYRFEDRGNQHVRDWNEKNYQCRPFRFEDLEGKPEPEKWGPTYPKTASAAVEKWRQIARGRELTRDETDSYGEAVHAWIRSLNKPKREPDTLSERSNCASGQATEFNAAKHRATLKAMFHAHSASDRLAWAKGESKGFAKGERELTIKQVYEHAMAEKRSRTLKIAA